jgi:hypothetical protein
MKSYHVGVNNPASKLTEETVQEIRRRHANREGTYLSLAAEYDLALSTVGAILTRRSWKHI